MTPEGFLTKFRIQCFYHFTDVRNLPSIRALGGLLPWSELREKTIVPGGNDWSHEADARKGYDTYVHLCFAADHPMEYIAKQQGRFEQSCFLRIDPVILQRPGILLFSDVSNKAGVEPLTLADAATTLDLEILTHKEWLEPAMFERRRKACKYELLVPGSIPLSQIWDL